MNYKNTISSKIENVPRGIQGYGHIIKNVSSKSNVWMDPFKDWFHIWIQWRSSAPKSGGAQTFFPKSEKQKKKKKKKVTAA